jgi:hypothetical protein
VTPSSSIVFAGEVYGEGAVGGGVRLQRRGPVVIALRNKLLGVVMTWASGSIPVPLTPQYSTEVEDWAWWKVCRLRRLILLSGSMPGLGFH